MHYREITRKALELNMLDTEGKTPEATMYARILIEIKRYQKRGDQPRSVQHGRGYVSLGTHEQGLIITTSDFTSSARTEAARPKAVPVALMNGEQLVALMAEHEVGINRRPHDLLELVEADRRKDNPGAGAG